VIEYLSSTLITLHLGGVCDQDLVHSLRDWVASHREEADRTL
jgi:hypothetical protein